MIMTMKKTLTITILILLSLPAIWRCTPASQGLDGSVSTENATGITSSSAVLNGSIEGFEKAPREVGFEWGYTKNKLSEVIQSQEAPSSGSASFSALLEGLNDGVQFYYRAYALFWHEGQGVYRFGPVRSFKTPPIGQEPQPEPEPTPDPNPTPDPEPDPDPEPEPEPDPTPDPGPDPIPSGQPGWYELPVMNIGSSGNYMVNSQDTDQYYAMHLCPGGEKGPGGRPARNYTVCFSASKHCPLWVAAPRHSMYVGNTKRTDAYRQDAKIPTDLQYNSKDTGGGCNKGHMLGSAERTSSTATNRDVFFYTNIAPQLSSGFNTGGGGWNTLEDWVDDQVCSDTLYVIIGCYFDTFTDGYGETVSPKTISFGGRNDVGFPTMFYYVLMRTKKGNSGKALKNCTASEIKCAAFVRSHTNALKGQAVTSREMMSVSALEKITGVSYFANVPAAPKTVCNASDWGL